MSNFFLFFLLAFGTIVNILLNYLKRCCPPQKIFFCGQFDWGDILADNAIETVRRAEAGAEEAIRGAQQKAAKLLADAKSEAAALLKTAEDTARKQAAADLGGAQEAGKRALEDAKGALDAEMAALREAAGAKQPEAVRAILESLA